MLLCDAVQRRNKWAFFSPQFCTQTQRRNFTHRSTYIIYILDSKRLISLKIHSHKLLQLMNWETQKCGNICSLTALYLPVFFLEQKYIKLQKILDSSIDLFFHLSFFIYCWQIVDLPSSFLFLISSEVAIKEKMGVLESLQCLGGLRMIIFGDGEEAAEWKQRSWLCLKIALSDALIAVTVDLYYKIP